MFSRIPEEVNGYIKAKEMNCASLLCAQGERCTGDGGRQVQSLCDFSPDFLVDDLHQAPLLCHQLVKHVQIQNLFGHDGDTVDRGT